MKTTTDLHSGLDDVQRSVSEHAGGTGDRSKQSGQHGVDGFVGIISFRETTGGFDRRSGVPSLRP